MNIEEFRSLVWALSNQMFVRYYLALDHPVYRRFGLQFTGMKGDTLEKQLIEMGFAWDPALEMWLVDRKD